MAGRLVRQRYVALLICHFVLMRDNVDPHTDPIMSPCVGGELHLSTNLWRAFIKAGLLGGEVYVAGVDSDVRVDGVAVWFAPGKEFLGTSVCVPRQS